MKAILLGTTSALLATTLAFAQPTPTRPGASSAPNRTPSDAVATSSPATSNAATTAMGSPVNGTGWMTSEKAGEWRASKLKGVAAYNNSGEKIGDIEELIVGTSGKVDAVVLGVGGFLGMSEHQVAVPFSDLQFMDSNHRPMGTRVADSVTNAPGSPTTATPSTKIVGASPMSTANTSTSNNTSNANRTEAYPERVVLNMTRDQLKAAPAFKYTR